MADQKHSTTLYHDGEYMRDTGDNNIAYTEETKMSLKYKQGAP